MSADIIVQENSSITLNFALSLLDGSEIDSNFDGEPVAMKIGDGNMLPGFEKCLIGLVAGSKVEQTICAEDAFGGYNDENIQRFKKSSFDSDLNLEKGLVINFADPAGGGLPGVVQEIDGDWVFVDFNHPLAGRDIIFKAFVHSVE